MLDPTSAEWKNLIAYMQLQDIAPDSADAALIQSLHTEAVEYLEGAEQPEALYQHAIRCLVLDWYDNRGSGSGGSEAALTVGTRRVINQLKQKSALEGIP